MPNKTVEFSSLVPQAEYEFFKENFPQYGAVKWFINTMLREFNEQIRQKPLLREDVDAAIQHTMEMGRLIREASRAAQSAAGPKGA
jgi:hypothetical protein